MTGAPSLGVPGFCAGCEDYTEQLVKTGERTLCPDCAKGTQSTPVTYTDLSTYRCDCRGYEIAAIGSLEERNGFCAECIQAVKSAGRLDLDAPTVPDEFSARSPGDRGVLDL